MVFEPSNPAQCSRVTQFLNHEGLGEYTGNLGGLLGSYAEDTAVLISLYRDEYNDICYWHILLTNLNLSEFHEIDRSYVTCQDPSFTLSINTAACSGTLTIARYDMTKVPFLGVEETGVFTSGGACSRVSTWSWSQDECSQALGCEFVGAAGSSPTGFIWIYQSAYCLFPCTCPLEGQEFTGYPTYAGQTLVLPCENHATQGSWSLISTTNSNCDCTPSAPASNGTFNGQTTTTTCNGVILPLANPCTECATFCRTLCVRYTLGAVHVRKTFRWDANYQRYVYSLDGIDDFLYLELDADYETCVLVLDIQELTALGKTFDPYPLYTPCTADIDLAIPDITATFEVGVSCNKCSCWDWICDHCRCACTTLCLLIYRNGILQLRHLNWVFDDLTNLGKWTDGYESVGLSKDAITGDCQISLSGFNPLVIGDCGTAVQFTLENIDGDQAFGACQKNDCFNVPATCCVRDIIDLPLSLTATVTNAGDCSCAGNTITLVWNPFGLLWKGRGSIGPCGHESVLTITVLCSGDSLIATVTISCGDDGLGNPLIYNPNVTIGYVQCDPIEFTITGMTIDRSCCYDEPMAGGSIAITITE